MRDFIKLVVAIVLAQTIFVALLVGLLAYGLRTEKIFNMLDTFSGGR